MKEKDETRLKWLDSVESMRGKIAEKMGFIRSADAGIFNSVDVNDKNGRSRKLSPQIRKTTRHRSSN